jgi:hypothetical protein
MDREEMARRVLIGHAPQSSVCDQLLDKLSRVVRGAATEQSALYVPLRHGHLAAVFDPAERSSGQLIRSGERSDGMGEQIFADS